MSGKPTVEATANAIGAALTAASDSIRYLPYMADTFSVPGTPPGSTAVPAIVMLAIGKVEFHVAFGGGGSGRAVLYPFTVHAILARSDDRSAWLAAQDLMSADSPTSIRAALEADTTYGGVAQTAICRDAGPPSALEITPGSGVTVPYLWIPFTLDVWV